MYKYLQLFFSLIKDQFIPAVISIVAALTVYYFIPSDCSLLKKFGMGLFVFFLSLVVLLAVNFIVFLSKKIKRFINNVKDNRLQEIEKETEYMKLVDDNNTFFDSLSTDDQYLLYEFLFRKNKPLLAKKANYYDKRSLLDKNDLFYCTAYQEEVTKAETETYWTTGSIKDCILNGYKVMEPLYLFKMKDDAFFSLVSLYNEQGYLGHFKEAWKGNGE